MKRKNTKHMHYDSEFEELVRDIVSSEEYCKMKEYKHHMHGNTYDHSVRVAYLCYLHCKRKNKNVNLKELVRGALLHDYFLYNRHTKEEYVNGLIHNITHPKRALENAIRHYPDLTQNEQDMIRRHMFPLTPVPPHTLCGWLVCYYDKVAAISEYFKSAKVIKLQG